MISAKYLGYSIIILEGSTKPSRDSRPLSACKAIVQDITKSIYIHIAFGLLSLQVIVQEMAGRFKGQSGAFGGRDSGGRGRGPNPTLRTQLNPGENDPQVKE